MKEVLFQILLVTYTSVLGIVVADIKSRRKRNRKMQDRLDEITDIVRTTKEELELFKATTSRYRLIRASDDILAGYTVSEERIESLGEDIEVYRNYCETHPDYINHKGQRSMALIEEYEKKQDSNHITNLFKGKENE